MIPSDDTEEDGGQAASVKGGGGQSESKGHPRTPYFQGQQTRHSYQLANIPHQDSNENDCDETEDLKHSSGNDRGRSRGRGSG